MTKLLPTITLVLSIGSALVYAWDGDWRKALYWGAASLITVAVTF